MASRMVDDASAGDVMKTAWYLISPRCSRTNTSACIARACVFAGGGRAARGTAEPVRARYIVNDSFRTDVCLYYKPHMIAMAALLLACTFHECTLPSPSLNLR